MNFRFLLRDNNLLWEAVIVSLVFHIVLINMGKFSFQFFERHTVEIDITSMGHIGMQQNQPKPAIPALKEEEWIKAARGKKVKPAPIPKKPVPPPKENPPEQNEYSGTTLSRIPLVSNFSDLKAILQKFYPEQARIEGRESDVTLDMHIDTEGTVRSVDIVSSGGSDFDEAAIKVAKLLKFTPAFVGSHRVAVKLRQTFQFRLEE